jgi:RHS repeat-associated protein
VLTNIYHTEGRVIKSANTFTYEYWLKDHLGNTRVNFVDDNNNGYVNNSEIRARKDYYTFGMEWDGAWTKRDTVAPKNRFGYNGKEMVEEMDLELSNYGGRWGDLTTGRWLQVDPLAHKMPKWSPYSMNFNNPIRFIDLDGLYPIEIITRSYAPFKTFGPAFARYHGDARGNSLVGNASYRTSVGIKYDTETYTRSFDEGESLSYKVGSRPKDGTYSKTFVKDRSSKNKLDVHSYGNNADQPGSWDIDQFTKLTVATKGDIKGDHTLNIVGSISGDNFPNQESLISDKSGNTLWLGNFITSGGKATGPTMSLARENEEDVQININISIRVNSEGIFQGVIHGDKMISISDWNKKFK